MEEEGKIIEVSTKPGKNDRHYEDSGRFAPKDGFGSETTRLFNSLCKNITQIV